MKVYPIMPAFIVCEDDSAIDLGKVVSFDISEYQESQPFSLFATMVNGRVHTIKSGFKTIANARTFRNKILSFYRKF